MAENYWTRSVSNFPNDKNTTLFKQAQFLRPQPWRFKFNRSGIRTKNHYHQESLKNNAQEALSYSSQLLRFWRSTLTAAAYWFWITVLKYLHYRNQTPSKNVDASKWPWSFSSGVSKELNIFFNKLNTNEHVDFSIGHSLPVQLIPVNILECTHVFKWQVNHFCRRVIQYKQTWSLDHLGVECEMFKSTFSKYFHLSILHSLKMWTCKSPVFYPRHIHFSPSNISL